MVIAVKLIKSATQVARDSRDSPSRLRHYVYDVYISGRKLKRNEYVRPRCGCTSREIYRLVVYITS